MEIRFTQTPRHDSELRPGRSTGDRFGYVRAGHHRAQRFKRTRAPAASSAARKAAGGLRTRAYYDAIVKRDIFNQVPQETGPAPVVEEDLHLKLIGTSLQSKSKPYAIIEDQTNNESLYQVGEDIPDAGKLVSVETNRAIIDRGGHRVAIEIPVSDIPEAPASALSGATQVAGAQRLSRWHAAQTARGFGRPAAGDDNNE